MVLLYFMVGIVGNRDSCTDFLGVARIRCAGMDEPYHSSLTFAWLPFSHSGRDVFRPTRWPLGVQIRIEVVSFGRFLYSCK